MVQALDLVAAAVRAGADPRTAVDFATAQLGLVGSPLAPGAIIGLALDSPATPDPGGNSRDPAGISGVPVGNSTGEPLGGFSGIEISDDGAGMDPEKIKAHAVRRGILTLVEAERMSSRQAIDLLFRPGFSTAEKVTSISGRGVGMDVVRSHLERAGGQVDARAWRLSDTAGVPLADAIDVGVHLLRADRAARSRVDVALAGPRATIRVLTFLPLAGPLLGAALGVSPTAWVDSPIAVASVVSGVVLMVIGRWWCARMVAQLGPGSTRLDPLEVAATTDLLALVLRGGCGVVDGLEQVAAVSDDDVAADLASVAAAVRWGMPWARAWAAVGPGWSAVGRALVLADSLGVAPSDPLARAASDQRRDHGHRLEIDTARLGVRIVLPLGLAFLPAFVLLGLVPLVLALAGELWRG